MLLLKILIVIIIIRTGLAIYNDDDANEGESFVNQMLHHHISFITVVGSMGEK
jgi:hypothetical protein